jgi:DNA-binding response OmpR family regulator
MPEPADPAKPVSVLVVEDVRDIADTLAEFLRLGYGFEVRVASDGATGLKWAAADPPDAIVCDLGLPGLDGRQVASQVRELVSPAPLLIAVTAYGGTFTREVAGEAFDHFFVKPADPFQIAALIEAHARRPRGPGE